MYTLKGIFPEPKKEQTKNFIKENKKQLKYIQGKTKEATFPLKNVHPSRLTTSAQVAMTSSGQMKPQPPLSNRISANMGTSSTNTRKKNTNVHLKKGDMAEFLKRKELRHLQNHDVNHDDQMVQSPEEPAHMRDIGCQTESNLADKLTESTKLTTLYSQKDNTELECKMKASGDMIHNRSPQLAHRSGEAELLEMERNRNHLSTILERKDRDKRDPYLPAGYQKGVVPKYLRDRKEQSTKNDEDPFSEEPATTCPDGHVPLPDMERKETLRMLRNSFAELVSELNKMPVKTDTLRMRNRKMELERQLAKLEEGIKVFSRRKVFVKVGE